MPNEYTVKQGECISSLAFERGFLPDTIWGAPENRSLKKQRGDLNVLLPGDLLVIPEKQLKQEQGVTEKHHRFCRKGLPVKLRLQFLRGEDPMAEQPYVLEIDGILTKGRTDEKGLLEEVIPANANGGILVLGEGEHQREFELALGSLDPVSVPRGQRARLNHLGFDCGWSELEFDASLGEALTLFRQTSRLDDADDVIAELGQVHGA